VAGARRKDAEAAVAKSRNPSAPDLVRQGELAPGTARAETPRAATVEGVRTILAELDALVTHATRQGFPSPRQHAANRAARRRRVRGTVGSALGMASMSALTAQVASATFTGSAAVSQGALTAGTMSFTVDPSADAAQTFNSSISDFSPGVTRERLVNLTIGGNINAASLKLVIADCTAGSGCSRSHLDDLSGTTDPLQVVVDNCSVPWTGASGSAPDKVYATCSGTQTSVLASTSLNSIVATGAAGVDISTNSLLTTSSTNYYRMRFTLPTGTANTTQGQTSILQVKFLASQRAGTNK
jgi:hypothetical protein